MTTSFSGLSRLDTSCYTRYSLYVMQIHMTAYNMELMDLIIKIIHNLEKP